MNNILSAIAGNRTSSVILQRADHASGMDKDALTRAVESHTETLQQLGFRRHHKIALALSEGEPSTITALLAAVNSSIAVPLRRFENDEMTAMSLDTASPDALLLDVTVENFREIKALAEERKIPVILLHPSEQETGTFTLDASGNFSGLGSGSASAPEEDDIAIIFQTSGTTGTPKLVGHTHGQFIHNAAIHKSTVGLKDDEPLSCLNILSQRAQWGITTALTTLITGGTLKLYPHPQLTFTSTGESKLPFLIEKAEANWLPLTPPSLQELTDLVKQRHYLRKTLRDNSLKIIETSSSPSHPSLLEEAQTIFPHASMLQTFGATETGPITANTSEGNKIGSVGKPVKDVELNIVTEEGKTAAAGEMGELWVRGPSVARYYDNDAANQQAFTEDGFYKTGDIVMQDREGYIRILGRKTEIIHAGKHAILPSVIDADLQDLDSVKQVVSFAFSGNQSNIGILVVPEVGINTNIIDQIQKKLPDLMFELFFVSSIPEEWMTAKGSPRRNVIADAFKKNTSPINFLESSQKAPAPKRKHTGAERISYFLPDDKGSSAGRRSLMRV